MLKYTTGQYFIEIAIRNSVRWYEIVVRVRVIVRVVKMFAGHSNIRTSDTLN